MSVSLQVIVITPLGILPQPFSMSYPMTLRLTVEWAACNLQNHVTKAKVGLDVGEDFNIFVHNFATFAAVLLKNSKFSCLALLFLFLFVMGEGCRRDPNDRLRDAESSLEQARLRLSEGKPDETVKIVPEALAIFSELQRDSSIADGFVLLATAQRQLGAYDSALTNFQNAMTVARRSGVRKLERSAQLAFADVSFLLQDFRTARDMARDAGASAAVFSDSRDAFEAQLLAHRASARLGDFDDAARFLNEAARIDSQYALGRKQEILTYRFDLYRRWRDNAKLKDAWLEWKSFGGKNDSVLAAALYAWGEVQLERGLADSAFRTFSQALSTLPPKRDSEFSVSILTSLGVTAYELRRFDDARRYFEESIAADRHLPKYRKASLEIITLLTQWRAGRGRIPPDVANNLIARLDVILNELHQGSSNNDIVALGYFVRGLILDERGALAEAISSYERALEGGASAKMSDGLTEKIARLLFRAEGKDYYTAPLELFCKLSNGQAAFALAEMKNLRELQNFFSRLDYTKANIPVIQPIIKLLWCNRLITALSSEQQRVSISNDAVIQSFVEKKEALQRDYVASARELRQQFPRFQYLFATDTISVDQVRNNLADGSAILEPVFVKNGAYLLLIRNSGILVRRVEASQGNFQAMLMELHRRLSEYSASVTEDGKNTWNGSGRQAEGLLNNFSGLLLQPIQKELTGLKTLYVVPPPEYPWLPFHCLSLPLDQPQLAYEGEGNPPVAVSKIPLVSKIRVRYLPTSAVLLFDNGEEKMNRNIVGLGFPGKTSADVEYELKDIRSFFEKARMLFDTAATLTSLKSIPYDVLHVAAEWNIDLSLPQRSGTMLSDGTLAFGMHHVQLSEWISIPAPRTMVVSNLALSSLGEVHRYMAMLMLANGSGNYLGNSWRTDRRTKRTFGEVFYTGLSVGIAVQESYDQTLNTMIKQSESGRSLLRWGIYGYWGK